MALVRKAERKKAKLRLGISAPAGAGKTMGALFLAYGLTGDWSKIGLLDTEEGSGELYAGMNKNGVHIGEFLYSPISAPYTIAKYLEGIKALERECDVVIIDSLSHAWAGTGGILEKQGKLADATKNSYTAWRFVTPEQTSLVDAMLQSPRHIIATMRSKTEYVLEKNEKGQMAPRKVGMAPVQREGMEYEFTVVFDINFDSIARAIKDRTDLFSTIDGAGRLEKREFMITPATGQEIMHWLNTGAETLDTLCERLVGIIRDTKSGDNLREIYAENGSFMLRLQQERPDYAAVIGNVFNDQAEKLGLS